MVGTQSTGNPVQLLACDGSAAQTWQARADGSLLNPGSGLCLDATNGNTGSGTALQAWTCNGTSAQRWNLTGVHATSYTYDSAGNQLTRTDDGTTTVYLGADELTVNADRTITSATRYYATPGAPTVVRVSPTGGTENVYYQYTDPHGTASDTLNAANLTITRRMTTPFGESRGAHLSPGDWLTDRGYVGGTQDDVTGLANLGAREYNSSLGRFLNSDPLLDLANPQQWNGYAYSDNNPVNLSDPSGLMVYDPTSGYAAGTGTQLQEEIIHSDITVEKVKLDNFWHDYKTKANVCVVGPRSKSCVTRQQADREKEFNKFVGKMLLDATLIIPDIKCTLGGGDGGRNQEDCDTVGLFMSMPEIGPIAHDIDALEGDLAETAARECARSHSFTADTRVLMANGQGKRIEDVKVGDEIANAAPGGSTLEKHRVIAVHRTTTDTDFTRLTFETTEGKKSIESTSNHPYYDASTHSWTHAGDVKAGDRLQTLEGAEVTVLTAVSYMKPQVTYDLTIEDLHTYYVLAGTTPVLVHNTGPGCGLLEGERDYDVYHPETGNRITDIDHVGGGVLWEEKSALYGDDGWISKQIDGKLKKYIEARQYMPGYENAPIGFRLTNPSIDPRFRSALESHIDNLRQANPGVDIRLEFAQ